MTCNCEGSEHTTSRRAAMGGAIGMGLLAGLPLAAMAQSTTQVRKDIPSPDQAIDMLMAGNKRFIDGDMLPHDHITTREKLDAGQQPIAAVIRCADSRSAPEVIFDQGIGDLFVCAVAGNVPTDELIASIEYSVAVLKTPLIVVMGHSKCGAVDESLKNFNDIEALPGRLPSLISQILPAAIQAGGKPGDEALVNAIRYNVQNGMRRMPTVSSIISGAVESGSVKIVGGVYDMPSGRFEMV
ncbi:MAG: carbonic anhydrase [Phycisphaerales bacterium]|nr:carbonic anhydrase [Phycisphaerales bacterium]